MLTEERLDFIRQQLSRDGKVIAGDLAIFFKVSEDTVRRDLRELAKSGECRRVYGGALVAASNAGSIDVRQAADPLEKQKLGKAVASLISANQTLFIDAGSTNLAIARALPKDIQLMVITNAPGVVSVLSDHKNCSVLMLGGLHNRDKGANLGSITLREIRYINADIFILGACGIDPAMGVTALDVGEAEVKRAMLDQSASLIVAATADKIRTVAPFKVADASAVTHLVVERPMASEIEAGFAGNGTAIHIAS
ncbi:MAG: DeoR family transcriptional regulator [Devosia sp.]|uniref:DeoR/GlpR family DNA-binding transcription regulator n=1 Tax=Devosia sp. TaxID=1871048 RepID=UPI0026113082|nr:DeoR/GlpR family DNA-binding transcription regulator [Devosia sp.]MDB5531073.1 DeoR family transcriptional regulator [Devosia sp.]